jgi:hypothetical protein
MPDNEPDKVPPTTAIADFEAKKQADQLRRLELKKQYQEEDEKKAFEKARIAKEKLVAEEKARAEEKVKREQEEEIARNEKVFLLECDAHLKQCVN